MERPVSAIEGHPPARVTLRGDKLARAFLVLCLGLCAWLAVSPTKSYLQTRAHAAQIHAEKLRMEREQKLLGERSADLSRGSGLEEQARRQGLIESTERSYVIEDVPQP